MSPTDERKKKIGQVIKNDQINNLSIFRKCIIIKPKDMKISQNDIKWILDFGAMDHMTENINALKIFRIINNEQYFTVANNENVKIEGWGMTSMFKKRFLQNVFYVENCSVNLLSISKLSKDLNCKIIFKKKIMIFRT
jgi:hypothetical protein